MPIGRFQPYGTPRVRPDEYSNAEAGPSTLMVPPVPYIDPPTSQPSGGVSETTADAEQTQTNTEEDKASVSNFYCPHIPHVTEWSFGVRRPKRPGSPAAMDRHAPVCGCRRMPASCVTGSSGGRNSREFRALTRLWKVSTYPIGENGVPDSIDCNAVAVEIIPKIRPLVYLQPRLRTAPSTRTSEGSNAKEERERRNLERRSFQELSRYYLLPVGRRKAWDRPKLLSNGEHYVSFSLPMTSRLPESFSVLEDLEGLWDL